MWLFDSFLVLTQLSHVKNTLKTLKF